VTYSFVLWPQDNVYIWFCVTMINNAVFRPGVYDGLPVQGPGSVVMRVIVQISCTGKDRH
jgi:hypothetical protein